MRKIAHKFHAHEIAIGDNQARLVHLFDVVIGIGIHFFIAFHLEAALVLQL
jgi:hypothetical protein